MGVLENTEPKAFFKFFEEISAIPRGSNNTGPITEYLVKFAQERDFKCFRDSHDNVIIKKPAQGSKSRNPVIIQGHTDMVTVAKPGKIKDFENEGIELIKDGDYIYADGTTLGADDGVAVCYALAILDDKEIVHPPIEAIFTSNEEIGLIGAGLLDVSKLNGKTFLNIDSEDDGIFFSGCAGGATLSLSRKPENALSDGCLILLSLSGFKGGHSGMEIDKHRANANKLLGGVLCELLCKYDTLELVSFEGGEKDNAIAAFANASILLREDDLKDSILKDFEALVNERLKEFKGSDPDIKPETVIKGNVKGLEHLVHKDAAAIMGFLNDLEDGALSMSDELSDVVLTSSNLGVVSLSSEGCDITVSVRSLINSLRDRQLEKIKRLAGDHYEKKVSGVYSAWSYNANSPAREMLIDEYEYITGNRAKVQVIHAGLECGVFAEKMPGTDFVSFGPQADDIHTYNERLKISSVADYWEILKRALKKLAENS